MSKIEDWCPWHTAHISVTSSPFHFLMVTGAGGHLHTPQIWQRHLQGDIQLLTSWLEQKGHPYKTKIVQDSGLILACSILDPKGFWFLSSHFTQAYCSWYTNTNTRMSRLKYKILLYNPIPHFYSYSSGRKWWFDVILSNTKHLVDPEVKSRKIWSPEIYIACHVWNSNSFSKILFPSFNHIHHEGNDDLMLLFQIQDIWRTLKSKEGRIGSLKFI